MVPVLPGVFLGQVLEDRSLGLYYQEAHHRAGPGQDARGVHRRGAGQGLDACDPHLRRAHLPGQVLHASSKRISHAMPSKTDGTDTAHEPGFKPAAIQSTPVGQEGAVSRGVACPGPRTLL